MSPSVVEVSTYSTRPRGVFTLVFFPPPIGSIRRLSGRPTVPHRAYGPEERSRITGRRVAARRAAKMAGQDGKWQKEGSDQNFDYMFKLLIIGNSSVGKTSFLFRYADDSFTSAFVSTVGIDFKVKTVFRHDKRVKLQIWVSTAPPGPCPIGGNATSRE